MGSWLASVDERPAEAVGVLRGALEDEEPLVLEHAAWASGRAQPPDAETGSPEAVGARSRAEPRRNHPPESVAAPSR